MKRIKTFLILLCCITVGFSSCKKITEDQVVNGLWVINWVQVGLSTDNYLNQLPHYSDGNDCCFYKLNFERDGVVLSYYIAHNNFVSVDAGNWSLNSGNEIVMKVGTFIDGTFDIEKTSLKHWRLSSSANHIAAYDSINPQLDTAYTLIDMKKI